MKFLKFEINYWLRQPMVYVFFVINTLLIFGATSSDNISVGGSFGNILKNAPYVIETYYSIMSFITVLMTTSFILASTVRDFTYNSYQIIFTTPVNRIEYLLGRFFGATIISIIPLLGVSLGIILGCMMPWMDPEKIGPFIGSAHISAILHFAIPNTIFGAAVIFMIAALTRSTIASFVGSLVLLVIAGIASSFAGDLDKQWLSVLLDPFGTETFSILTKYWTVSQKNTEILSLSGMFLANRIIWLSISAILIFITVKVFSFTEKSKAVKKKLSLATDEVESLKQIKLPVVHPTYDGASHRTMFRVRLREEIKGILKSPTFIVLIFAGLLNFIPSLLINSSAYGLTRHPVTYSMIDTVQGSFYSFLIAIIVIYSGLLVWKERDNKIEEIYDATPHPTWVSWLSKFSAIAIIVFLVQVLIIIFCITTQVAKGFTDIRPDVYIKTLLGIDYFGLLNLVVMAMLMHTLINNKYIAFFAFIIFMLLNNFLWVMLDVTSNMTQYSGRPSYIYSDMNGFGPYVTSILWFRGYWLIFAIMLGFITIFAWARGKETSFKNKLLNISRGLKGSAKPVFIFLLIAWVACGGFVFYNTKVLNKIVTDKDMNKVLAEYERRYKKYEGINQPRITDIKYNVDIYPAERNLFVKGRWWIKNKGTSRIDSVHISLPQKFKVELNIPGSNLVLHDTDHYYLIYRLDKSMMPGDSIQMSFTSEYISKGFENEVGFTSVVDNGSFFNNADFSPQIGYQPEAEIPDRTDRKKNDLPERERMPKLERNCTTHCMNTYLSNNSDWIKLETILSTSSDQIAVAPGSLVKQWKEGNRNYYDYKPDHFSLNFFSFISARYEVLRDKWNGIDVEVYYDKSHPYNIKNMQRSMKKSLEYYTTHFGPYYNKQVRIIEFPRYASFAQAFPGTMPYSEGIGFIAKIEDKDDIDMVFYVVAHEMAHQYWAHQLIGANMQGATLLSETFAQYSALMVMEKEYGRNAMRKFLKYEMDNYLRSRGTERLKEVPLMYVEDQGYIHYRKGSLVMYYLREMIGEENVNKALRSLLETYGYKEPPYPTSYMAVDAFKSVTPDSLQYIITDLFETMTFFNNKTTEVSATKTPDGKYAVTINFESQKFRADSLGRETEIPVNDWIEVGVTAKPEAGSKIGNIIFRQKMHVTQKENKITLMVDQEPYEAGVDPMNLMIDLVSDDNLKKITMPN